MTQQLAGVRLEQVAGRREWIGLAVLALPALLASLELTVTHLALPTIGKDLTASSTQLLWIVDVYAFLLAGSLITMGVWGDRIGRRRLLLIGAAGYGVASVGAAYAPTVELLIGARAVMGVAGSTLMPATLSLVTAMFGQPRQRAVAIGIIVASVSGGTAIGPLTGGWLLERFWWGSVFLLGVPVMALLLVVGPRLLPERREPTAGRLDIVSALLSLAAVLPVVYGLKRIAAEGAHVASLAAVAVGLACAVLFGWRQRGKADPFIDLRLFINREFSVAAATLAVGIFVLWGSNYAIAQYLQLVHGLSPLAAGMWTAPSAVGVIVGSTLAPRIARKVRPAVVTAVGLAVAAVGYGVLTQVEVGGLATLVAGAVVVSAGLGPMMALATDMVVGAAPARRAGAAAAISSTAPQLGGAFGIAILGSVITVVYQQDMAVGVPASVPDVAAAAARDNLNAALVASGRLPEGLGDQLLGAAREAFTHGFQLMAAVSAVLMVVTSLLVVIILGRVRR
ncbi:MFS transporter [Micromonospora qiuiae]|uniref:MFS transporter n=1 Tax=Micromonospora qiuiae TaxID=502268 RepID=A0ABQ4J4C1_9ACTN|nr:MFS transporter [Micromonospora qiuiae]GIJ24860.1 MFS transporter [Micromonospora qiuiae]